MKSELKLSYIPMCPTYHMCCHIFGVFDFCEVTATKIRHRAVGPRAVERGPITPSQILADHSTLSELSTSFFYFWRGGGQKMPPSLPPPPLDFQNLLRPWFGIALHHIKECQNMAFHYRWSVVWRILRVSSSCHQGRLFLKDDNMLSPDNRSR